MIKTVRTGSNNEDFIQLVTKLDELLAIMDGREHAFYNQYNQIDNIKHVVLLYLDELPVACGAIKEFATDTMEIKRMFTSDKFRGRGLASTVLKELEDWAKELGYAKCVLETGRRLPDAVRLYQNKGYLQISNYGQYIGMDNSICFEKQLRG
jgi:GNAT superfamily N-acetyltransferase